MAIEDIPEDFQNIWDEWNLRVAVLFSIFFQTLLFFFGSARKSSGNIFLQMVIWSSYLLAEWVAIYALGLISDRGMITVNDFLVSFWTPFLVIHLGGPDTITAFSLEDNQLWLRLMFKFFVQVVTFAYMIFRSGPNEFWLPTLLVFLAGTIKFAERVRALYLACLSNLKKSISPHYIIWLTGFDYRSSPEQPLKEVEKIRFAYYLYNNSQGLICDSTFSSVNRISIHKFFSKREQPEVFELIEIELNFIYEALYTKMAAIHNEILGFIFLMSRFVTISMIITAFVLFVSRRKPNVHPADMVVTYALLIVAVSIEFIALVKLFFSDWTLVLLSSEELDNMLESNLKFWREKRSKGQSSPGYVYQHSLISGYWLRKPHDFLEKVAGIFALKEILHIILYRRKQQLDEHLPELMVQNPGGDQPLNLHQFIFNEVKYKGSRAMPELYGGRVMDKDVAKEIYSARGEWTLEHYRPCPESIKQSVDKGAGYDEIILMWHIATDICYYKGNDRYDKRRENKRWCKQLSDYMFYLLSMQPKLMSSVSNISLNRLQKISDEAKKLFKMTELRSEMQACQMMLDAEENVYLLPREEPEEEEDERNKIMLLNAVKLAKGLKEKMHENSENTWEMMSKVWVELLCYGATHCRGDAHAQQLRQGRELISFVWILMAHFGLGEQFRLDEEK